MINVELLTNSNRHFRPFDLKVSMTLKMANYCKGSSFTRKGELKNTPIPGTKGSLQNAQLLISSGLSSFDRIIGGGLPVGALIMLDEDANGTFSKLLMKYFIVEGITSNQAIHLCSNDIDPYTMVKELPRPIESETNDVDSEVTNEKMAIAWRYQNMKQMSSNSGHKQHFGHYYDLSSTIDSDLVKNSDISYWLNSEGTDNSFEESRYGKLLLSIQQKLEKEKYLANTSPLERKILRLGLIQIGSPLWPKTEQYLPRFLYCLRALVRNSFSTCVITVPFHLYENINLKLKCIHLSDMYIQLETFSGTQLEKNVALRDYNGFFRIVKWAGINCLVTGITQCVDLALKLRRRKLVIEKLHLPPDLDDSTPHGQDDSIGCGSSNTRLMEF